MATLIFIKYTTYISIKIPGLGKKLNRQKKWFIFNKIHQKFTTPLAKIIKHDLFYVLFTLYLR
jgi:hypothetical protein